MSYVDQSRRPSPTSMAAVVGIHAALGAALVFGLTVSGEIPDIITNLPTSEFEETPPPPPPPPPPPADNPKPAEPARTEIFTPVPKLDLKPVEPIIPTTNILPPVTPVVPQPGRGTELVQPSPKPSFDPVAARPRNNPGAWLTDNDYRPAWARRELEGTARFRLEIAANGTITNCTVTGSTGHAELDEATCALLRKRAKFEPARGGNGEAVAGSYASAVKWVLPE